MSEYKIPRDLADVFEEYRAAENLMRVYADKRFGYKKALKASRLSLKKRAEFWKKVYKLYPDIKGVKGDYDADKLKLILLD